MWRGLFRLAMTLVMTFVGNSAPVQMGHCRWRERSSVRGATYPKWYHVDGCQLGCTS
jgi:hypothetical protein